MIELGLLGLLNEQSLHGYELRKQLGELAGSWSLSFGSLYPALNRLERAELVKAVEANEPAAPAIPMTGALSGELAAFRQRLAPRGRARSGSGAGRRGKKVYGITDRGRDRLTELLLAPGPDDDRSFALRVAFCGHLAPAQRLALFERRRAELVDRLGRTAPPRPAGRRTDPYRRSLRERAVRAVEHDVVWLDELIAATRDEMSGAGTTSPVPGPVAASPSLSTLTARPTGSPESPAATHATKGSR